MLKYVQIYGAVLDCGVRCNARLVLVTLNENFRRSLIDIEMKSVVILLMYK